MFRRFLVSSSRFSSSRLGLRAPCISKYAVGGMGGVLVASALFSVAVFADEKKGKKEEKVDYDQIRKVIAAILDQEDYDDGSLGPVLVRLAWHSAGTYDKISKTGGTNGATMRFVPESSDPGNAGLAFAQGVLEPIKAAFPAISYADLWVFAGTVAIEEMGGPKMKFTPGRKDVLDSKTIPPNGRLPDASKGAQHVREVFNRMGFNDQEMVALIGAHCLGRCHSDRSGYLGPWTRAPTTFSNLFFKELLDNNWSFKKWNGPKQYADPSGELMMLPADFALREDPAFRKYAEQYAKNEQQFFDDFASAWTKLMELGFRSK